MSRRGRATRWTGAVGAAAALLVLSASPAPGVAASNAPARCSTVGLRYTSASYGTTSSAKVLSLNARGVKCATARGLAGVVARDLLNNRAVPMRISGLAVTVKRPCAGCTPKYSGAATAAGKRVTFVIMGGA